jgi:hypothetical protein
MESIESPLGIGIEQDIYFAQKRLGKCVEKLLSGMVVNSPFHL